MLKIIEPELCHRLTTVDAVRADIGMKLKPGDKSEDVHLATLIDEVSAAAEAFTGRVFAMETVEETFFLPGVEFDLHMARYPVRQVETVKIAGDHRCGAEHVRINGTAHLSAYRDKARRKLRLWPDETQIRVRYRGGFVLPGECERNLPEEIERAVILGVVGLYRDPVSPALPPEAIALLSPFSCRPEAVPGGAIVRRKLPGRVRYRYR